MRPCLKTFTSEFKVSKLFLTECDPFRLYNSQWRIPPVLYLLFRFVLAVYADFWLIYTSVNAPSFNDIPSAAYLTNWTYFMLSLYFTLNFFTSVFCFWNPRYSTSLKLFVIPNEQHERYFLHGTHSSQNRTENTDDNADQPLLGLRRPQRIHNPWFLRALWVIFNIATIGAMLVTILFFVFLWPMFSKQGPIDLENLQLHGINTVLVFLDCCVIGTPVHLLHAVYTIIYGLIYIIFSAIYWSSDHEKHVMYPDVLDWNSPGKTVGVCVLAVVGILVMQFIIFLMYQLKLVIYRKCHAR